MFALDRAKYARLMEFSPGEQFWCGLWLGGLHQGTHYHWRLSPLSVVGLARLWRFFSGLDRWEPQRSALARLTRRRQGVTPIPLSLPDDNAEGAWDRLFADVLEAEAEIRKETIAWHRNHIEAGSAGAGAAPGVWDRLNELSAALLLCGYSTDELFNRAKDFVLDAAGLQPGSPRERLLRYFGHFPGPEERTYLVWTSVVTDTPWDTARLRKLFSGIILDSPAQLRGPGPLRAYLRQDGQELPTIISVVEGTHGVAQRHRFQALEVLHGLMARSRSLGRLSLGARTFMALTSDPDHKPWFYSRRPYAVPLPDAPNDAAATRHVGQSAQQLFDHPVGVIDDIFQVYEYARDTPYWQSVPASYHRFLRKDLGAELNAYRRRFEGMFRKPDAAAPPAAKLIGDVTGIHDHEALLAALRREAADENPEFYHRLEEVVRWPHGRQPSQDSYDTFIEFSDHLVLARGFRNALHHSTPITFDVYPLALHLAVAMLHGYSSWVRARSPLHA